MKPYRPFVKLSIFLTGLMIFITSAVNATTYFSSGNNDPGVLTNWWTGTGGTGTHPANFAGADVFTVQNGNTYTTTGTWTISGSVTVATGGTLVIAAGNAVTIPTLTITGTGTVTNNGSLTIATNLSGTGIFVNAGTGTLNYGSATTISVTTFTITAAGNTVNYNRAGTQTVKTGTYVNLTLSGTSAKTTTSVTVNGILTMGGTASVGTVPTYGAASTLFYDGSAAQTTSTEFPASFTGSGGVVSDNPLGVTINASKTVSKLTVNAGASFSTGANNAWTFTVSGTTLISGTLNINNNATKTFTNDVTVFSGGNMIVSSTTKTVITHNLIVNTGGTLTHNQVYDDASTILEVLGNLDINGAYTYTGFTPAIIMDAASGTWNINAQNTSLYQLFLKNAIFKCTGDLTVINRFYAMWNFDQGEFHTNGFDVTATTWGLVNAGGTVFVDGGSLTVGGAVGGILSGHTGPTGANAHFNVSSGTLTTTGLYLGIAPAPFTFNSTFTQTGGTVNANAVIVDGSTTASKYLQSGGTLNVSGPIMITSPAQYTCTGTPVINTGSFSSSGTFTGAGCALTIGSSMTNSGTFTANTSNIKVGGDWSNSGTFTCNTSTVTFNGGSNQTISNTSATPFYNFIVNPSLTTATATLAGNNISIVNNLTVTTGIFDMSTFTGNQSVAAGTFNLASGTQLRLAGANNFPSGYTTINLNATAIPTTLVEYYGTIPQSVSAQTYGNLTVSNNSTKTAAGGLIIKGDLNINSSSVFGGSTFSHSIAGDWNNNVSTSAYTPGTSTVTFNGGSAQTIGGTAGTTFNNLTISNASGVDIAQDQTVNSTLTLSAGNLTIGSNNLTLGSSALPVVGPFSATKMIVADGTGEVRKNLSAIGSYTFPIGDNTITAEYSPVALNYTAGTFAGGAYTGVNVTDIKHPNNASTTDYLTRYWTVSNSGITSPSFNVTATYLPADIAGTETNSAAAKYTGALPWVKYAVLGSNTLTSIANNNTGTGIVFTGITNAVPNVSITGGGVSICTGGSVSLGSTVTNNGTSSISYAWTPAATLSSGTVSNPTASPTSPTTYSLTVTDGNGITSSPGTTTITVYPVSVGGSVSGGAAVCSGTNSGTLTLSGQTGSVVRWEKSTDGGTTWTTIVNTTTTQTYTNLTVATLYRAVVQSGVCASANSASASMTINPVSVGGSVSGTAAVCSGTNSGILTLSGQTGSVVDWEYSTDGGTTWTTIVNTTTTQTYTNLTVATLYRAVVQSGVCVSANSASASMTINPVSVGGSVSGGAAVCSGTNSGTLTLSGQTGSIVRWEFSTDGGTTWSTIVNTTTTQTYTNLTVATLYRAVVQSGVCVSANSASASMTINPVSVGGSVSGGAAVCSGTNSGTLTLSGQTGSVVRWEFSTDGGTTWTTIVNTTTTQTYTNLTVASLYRAVVQSGVCVSANSASASMTINPVSVGGSVSGAAAVCSGTNSGTLTLSGQTGSVVRWEYSTDGGTTWTTIVNTTTTQTYTNLTVATLYRAVVQSGVCVSANSASASMTINPVSVGGSVSGGAAVCSGTNSGTLTLSGQTGSVVRWEYSTDGGTTWLTIVNTTTTQTYTNLTVATLYRAVVQSGVCVSANSASASMTINPVSIGGSVSGGAAVCSGTNSGTLTLSGQTGSVVRWEFSTDGGTTWTTIVNTTTTQTYTNLTVATLYRAVVQSGVCVSANSASASMTINPVSVGGSVSGAAAVCSGTNSGTLTLSGQTGSVVRWEFSTDGGTTWITIVNTTTTQTYTNLTVATLYRAVVQSGVCVSANSASASMTINPVSVGGSVSGGAAVCSGTNSGTLTLSGQTGSVVRWEKSTDGGTTWTTIVNTTTTQTYTNLTVATLYRAVVQSGVCVSANSASASMTINPVSVGGSVSGGAAVCSGTNSGTLTLSGQTGSIVRWEYSTDGGTTWTTIVNTTTTQTYTNLTVATLYRAVVQSGVCVSANSASASMTINPVSVGGSVSGGAAVCSGTNSGTLTLSGQTGSVVRWEFSTDGGTTWSTIVNTTTTQTYTNLTVATLYRAVVQSGVCVSANSASASMTINPVSVGGSVSGGAAVCSGTNSGTLTLSGQTGSVVRWEYSTDGGTTWTTIVNTTTTQTYTNLTVATLYRAVVQSGVCVSANSASASMTINPVSVGGSVSGGAAVCSGTNSGTLTLSGQTGSVVRWEYSTDGGTTWLTIVNTTTTQTYTNLTVATLYRAVVQSGVCVSANSTSASMTINPVSVGGSVSGGAAVCSGTNSGTLTLSGQTGSIVRWEFSTDGGTTWTTIVNTTTTQTYTNLTVATLYRAVVQSGVCVSANSASASMTINPVSVGGSVSGGAGVCSGTNSGTLTLSGQTGSVVRWEKSIDGGTTWTTIVNTTTTQTYTNLTLATLYRAVVQSGVCVSANSTSASMTINPVSVGGSVSGGAAVCSGTNSGTLTLSGQTGSVVRWEYSTDGGTTWSTIVNTTTTQTYTNLTVATLYRAVVQSGVCVSANSASASMTINPVSVGGSVSGGAAVCSGTNSGTLTLSGQTGSVVRWEFSTNGGTTWSTIVNTTTTQTYTNLTVATLYRAVVQSGVCVSANSASASMTINPVSVGGSVSGGAAVCSGTNSGTLTLSGQTGSIVRWEFSTDGGTTWTTIVNTTTTQTYTNLTVATLYRAVVQSGVCVSANSASASMTINPVSVGGSVSGAAAVCSGTNSGTLTLSGQTGSVVRWEYSTDGGTTWTTIVNTTTTQTYTNLTVATLYRAVVQSGVCVSANSASASMTINPVSVGGSVSGGAGVCSGTNSGTLTLSGQTGSVVRWEKSIDGGTTWTTIVNTTTTQTYTNLIVATLYRAVVQSGVCASANSASASMTINPVSVGGSVSGGAAVCSGTNSGTLTLSGQTGSVVRWEKSIDGGTTWTTIVNTTTTQTYTNLTVATLYRAVVQSGVCASANSASASMTINPVSVGGSVSGGAAVCSGTNSGTLTLSGQTGSVIRWESSTDGGTTWSTIVNTTTTQTYTNLTVATLYRAVVQSGVCASANSASASMTITTPPSATISYAGSPFCSNTGTASVTFSGIPAGNYSALPAGASINSTTGAVNLAASAPGSYTITYTVAASGGCALYTATASLVVNPNTWTGGISTDWYTAGNWSGNAVPALTCPDVTILAGVPYQPILNSGTFAIQNLYINSGASLTVSNATLQIAGTINNSGTFDVSAGAIEMNGSSSQTIAANAFQSNALKDLIISNSSSGGVVLGGALDVYGSVAYSSGGMKLVTNDFLTLKSTALNTAWIGDMTGNTITGKVTVERYISARKAWRFLSIPTNTSQTIKETWQEGATGTASNPVPGFGIQITGAAGTAAGFDLYSAAPSMKTYVPSTNTWIGVANTSTAGIKATDGYMTFIRGDRAANLVSSTPTQTVLRTKGDLYTGDQTPIVVSPGKFAAIGNPYASTLDMRYITKTGMKDFFYVWDPKLGGSSGYGAYQTFYFNGTDYCVTPGSGSYPSPGSASNSIASGQAFFVQADVSGGSLTFKEAAKTSGSAMISLVGNLPQPQLRANLYGVNTDNSTYMTDGLVISYDDGYSNKVDALDAIKSINTAENLSVKTANTLLVVERRHTILSNDTIFLNLTGTAARKYRFEFNAIQLDRPGLTAMLEDIYLNTMTQLNLNGRTVVDFTVTGVAASYAANRFRIVFTPPTVLPLTFTSIKASQKNKDISVEWQAENESNLEKYDVQKSIDGNNFITVNTVAAKNASVSNYNWLDVKPAEGNNYYRILSTDVKGKTEYSKIVKVFMGSEKRDITIYPNPAINGIINLQFTNQPGGTYGIKLLNKLGQVMITKQVPVSGNTNETISLTKNISSGVYQMEVSGPDGSKTSINVSILK